MKHLFTVTIGMVLLTIVGAGIYALANWLANQMPFGHHTGNILMATGITAFSVGLVALLGRWPHRGSK